MMSFDYEPFEDGIRITRLNSTEKDIVISDSVDGYTVRSIGPGFLRNSPGSGGRTLTVPGTVTEMDVDSMTGIMGLGKIVFQGDVERFCSFKVMMDHDCDLECTWSGKPYSFRFNAGCVMSFPAFDDDIMDSMYRMTPEVAIARLSAPVLLSDEHRDMYRRYLSDRIMPKAEQAVVNGDQTTIKELHSTRMLDQIALRRLLERSVRSGKAPMTSFIMSLIRKDSMN